MSKLILDENFCIQEFCELLAWLKASFGSSFLETFQSINLVLLLTWHLILSKYLFGQFAGEGKNDRVLGDLMCSAVRFFEFR